MLEPHSKDSLGHQHHAEKLSIKSHLTQSIVPKVKQGYLGNTFECVTIKDAQKMPYMYLRNFCFSQILPIFDDISQFYTHKKDNHLRKINTKISQLISIIRLY